MPLRSASLHVKRTLRRLDPRLGIVWNDDSACWRFTWEGAEQSDLFHNDGQLMVGELSPSELTTIFHRSWGNVKTPAQFREQGRKLRERAAKMRTAELDKVLAEEFDGRVIENDLKPAPTVSVAKYQPGAP
jgi:hypothetical protein